MFELSARHHADIPAAFLWDKLGAAKPFRLSLNSLQLSVHVTIACTSYQQTCYQWLESITFSIDHSIGQAECGTLLAF